MPWTREVCPSVNVETLTAGVRKSGPRSAEGSPKVVREVLSRGAAVVYGLSSVVCRPLSWSSVMGSLTQSAITAHRSIITNASCRLPLAVRGLPSAVRFPGAQSCVA